MPNGRSGPKLFSSQEPQVCYRMKNKTRHKKSQTQTRTKRRVKSIHGGDTKSSIRKILLDKFGELEYMVIPEGTLLYRSSPNICDQYGTHEKIMNNMMKCGDTGKTGIYMGKFAILAIAMSLEYRTMMEIGVFKLNKDITVSIGKYDYRKLHIEDYFNLVDGETKFNRDFDRELYPDENLSHFDSNVLPLRTKKYSSGPKIKHLLSDELQTELMNSGSGEVFLNETDAQHLEFVKAYRFSKKITPDELFKYMKKNNYPFHLENYIKDKIVKEKDC